MNNTATKRNFFPLTAILYRNTIILIASFLFITACRQPETKMMGRLSETADKIAATIRQKMTEDSVAKARISKKKKIYLTFDDGPNSGTQNVLNTIKAENVPVSFFLVGQHVADSRWQAGLFEKLKADSAIELCNHSYTHARGRYSSFYKNPGTVLHDFDRSKTALNFTNNVARMPGRNAWRIDPVSYTDVTASKAAIDAVGDAGYAVMGWDIEWRFDHSSFRVDADTELLLRQIANLLDAEKTKTPGHLVLLAHDQAFQQEEDVEKLRYVLQQLKNHPDYELMAASKYPGVINKKPLRPGIHAADKK